jgi:hypothetical protein
MDKIYMVMEYVEHDMKSLMELMKSRNKKWTICEFLGNIFNLAKIRKMMKSKIVQGHPIFLVIRYA